MTETRFDDIDALSALVSERYGEWGAPMAVTQQMIDQFADVTGDHQWIHIDVERAARESPFRATIAHGFLLLSLLPALRDGGNHAIVGAASVVNYGADRLRFISPVTAGSEVRVRRRIANIAAKPRGTQVTADTELAVVGSEKPALLYRSLALYLPG